MPLVELLEDGVALLDTQHLPPPARVRVHELPVHLAEVAPAVPGADPAELRVDLRGGDVVQPLVRRDPVGRRAERWSLHGYRFGTGESKSIFCCTTFAFLYT